MSHVHILVALLGGGSALLLAALALLIVRRGWQERALARDAGRARAFCDALLPHLLRPGGTDEALEPWRGDAGALAACTHFLALVRGDEREPLLATIDKLDLTAPVVARLGSPRASVRIAAIRALAAVELPVVRAALLHVLRHDRALEVRLDAALALVHQGVLPPLGRACAALEDHHGLSSPAHRIVLRAIAAARPAEALAAWHAGRHGPARLALTDALGSLGTGAAVSALRSALGDADPAMRCEALRALRRLQHPRAAPAIVAALGDPEWIVRVQAAAAAGALGLAEAAPRLRALLADTHWWVRYRAEEALARLELARAAA